MSVAADGSYSYDPSGSATLNALAAGATTTDTFTYTISDGNGGTDTATVTITVTGVNDDPTANDDTGATTEDSVLNVAASGVLTNDSDPDIGDSLTVTAFDATSTKGATVSVAADGSYSYDGTGVAAFQALATGATTTDTFTYTISDGNGGTDTATVTITVTGVNDDPTANDDSAAGFGTDEDTAFTTASVLTNDSDPDTGDSLTVIAVGTAGTQGLVSSNGDGTFDYDPNGAFESLAAGATATDTFTYTISDGNGGTDTATVTITITGVNDDPTATNDTGAITEDTVLNVAASGVLTNDNDPDTGDSLTVTAFDATSAKGATVSVAADGSYSYDPTGSATLNALAAGATTTDTFTYTISDGNGGTDTATVTITVTGVNDDPTATDDTGAITEDTVLNVAADGVLANDSDPDTGDSLTVTAFDATSAKGATVSVAADGSYSYDPTGSATLNALAAGATTTDTFTYTISDGNGGTDTATVTITITGVNDDPTANDDTGAITEDTVLNVAADGVLTNDTDPDTGDSLTVTAFDATSAKGATVSVAADGSYSYDPTGSATLNALAAGATTTDTFTYTISDGNGGTDTATVTITITGVNDDPTANDDGAAGFGTNEDTAFTTASVLTNDSDPDTGDSLTVIAVGTAGTAGLVSSNGDGTFDYDPNGAFESLAAGATTTDTFTYTISDGNGGTDTATVTITITGVNDDPTANDDTGAITEDTVLNVAADGVLTNDSDPDTGDSLSVTAFDATSAKGATVSVVADGSYSYDPTGSATLNALAAGATTTDTFTYTISDGNGGTDTATVTITVTGVNDDPTANDDTGATTEDSVLNVAASGVLTNDSDPDTGDSLTVTAFDATSTKGATVSVAADGSYSYDGTGVAAFQALAAGETTTDTFTYTISDGNGGTDTATVTITITGVNDDVTANDDSGATNEDTTLNVAAVAGVLANDSDPDTSDSLSVVAYDATSAKGAAVSVAADGAYSYNPTGSATLQALAAGATTTDTFTYTVSDGNGGTDTATVTITVTGVNDDPTAVNDTASTSEDNVLNVAAAGALANDSDVDTGDSLSVSAFDATSSKGAAVSVAAGGSYSYDGTGVAAFQALAVGESTTDTFTYTITDGNGGTDTATVTVTITGVNDGPTALDDTGATNEDTILAVAASGVLGNDSDPDTSDSITVTSFDATSSMGATVSVAADGSYSYDPTAASAIQSLAVGVTTTDSFTYTISDGNGGTDTATVTITLTGVNDGPTAVNDTYVHNMRETSPYLVDATSGVLANDSDIDTGDSLTVISFDATSTAGGAVAVNADGSFSYLRLDGHSGPDSFTYTVSDGNGGTSTATVTIEDFKDQPHVLDGEVIANTSAGNTESVMISFVSEVNPVNAYAKLYDISNGGQDGDNVLSNAGFNIPDTGGNYLFALEDANSIPETRVTDVTIEQVEILNQGTVKLRSDADTTSGPSDQFAFTAVITANDPTTPADEGVLVQGLTDSTDGGRTGSNPTADNLSDPNAATLDYIWGGGNNDTLTGGAGADFLHGGDGADSVSGGGGNDMLFYDPADTLLDGGTGDDIVRLDIDLVGNFVGTAANDVDLTGEASIQNIEVILITDDKDSDAAVGLDVTLSAADVISFTDTDNELYIVGQEGNTVSMGGGWTLSGTEEINNAFFDIYTQTVGAETATLKVDQEITVL